MTGLFEDLHPGRRNVGRHPLRLLSLRLRHHEEERPVDVGQYLAPVAHGGETGAQGDRRIGRDPQRGGHDPLKVVLRLRLLVHAAHEAIGHSLAIGLQLQPPLAPASGIDPGVRRISQDFIDQDHRAEPFGPELFHGGQDLQGSHGPSHQDGRGQLQVLSQLPDVPSQPVGVVPLGHPLRVSV